MRDPDGPGGLRFYLTRTNVERAHLEFSTNRPDMIDVDNLSGRRRPLEPQDRWLRARSPSMISNRPSSRRWTCRPCSST